MPVVDLSDFLEGYSTPDLEMLKTTATNYTCLLLQPSGPIFANEKRIGNVHIESAAAKGLKFLELAKTRGAHLAVTPEYFLPWTTLKNAILGGIVPEKNAFWVLGCESITPDDLEEFKRAVRDACLVFNEPYNTSPANGEFFDPVVLLFWVKDAEEVNKLVALVQFKTYPSRDEVFLEDRVLRKGSQIYRFRGKSGHLSAAAVICSDAFPLSGGVINELIDRSTLIHIQLNPDPRNSAYRLYRSMTFQTNPKVSDCHIICLNWAQSIVQHGNDGTTDAWNNIAGSAWYCSEDGCSTSDAITVPNHKSGLYYTCLKKEHRHALLFDYDEAVFELKVPNILRTGMAVMANQNGPSAICRYTWNNPDGDWAEVTHPPDTGFTDLLNEKAEAKAALEHILGTTNPFDIERLLALSAGTLNGMDDWHLVSEIDSCQMESDEVVNRITVAQDLSEKAKSFRHYRLARIASLHHEIMNVTDWPPQVEGMNNRARIFWTSGTPHFNVVTAEGLSTLVVHLGESPTPHSLKTLPDMLYNLLRRSGGVNDKRFCIIYRQHGVLQFVEIPALTRYDDAAGDMTDIIAVNPIDAGIGGDNA